MVLLLKVIFVYENILIPIQFEKIKIFLDETIPIRLFLSAYKLTPSYININNRFSVQYFLNLVLIDVEDRRYYKQHEIFLIRP